MARYFVIAVYGTVSHYSGVWHSTLLQQCMARYVVVAVYGMVRRYRGVWHGMLLQQCMARYVFIAVYGTVRCYSSVWHGTLLQNGLLSALPYLVMWLLSFVFSWVSDFLNKKQVISLGTSRKLFNSIGKFHCSCHQPHDMQSKSITFL